MKFNVLFNVPVEDAQSAGMKMKTVHFSHFILILGSTRLP